MRSSFDRRVMTEPALAFVRACQARVPCHLAGGAALSGAHLAHRLSRDIDLFCHGSDDVRALVRELPDAARAAGLHARLVRDSGTFVRAQIDLPDRAIEVDLVHEPLGDIEPADRLDEIMLESLPDLRASKVTCILSRSEPRDLVDLLFLDRAGHPPEGDLPLALRKDAGLDPGVLAWLLRSFPVEPLPVMLEPLAVDELRRFRDDLCERFRRAASG